MERGGGQLRPAASVTHLVRGGAPHWRAERVQRGKTTPISATLFRWRQPEISSVIPCRHRLNRRWLFGWCSVTRLQKN